jgi:hypothetical protein
MRVKTAARTEEKRGGNKNQRTQNQVRVSSDLRRKPEIARGGGRRLQYRRNTSQAQNKLGMRIMSEKQNFYTYKNQTRFNYNHIGHCSPSIIFIIMKTKNMFLTHFYTMKYENKIRKWQGVITLQVPIYRLK